MARAKSADREVSRIVHEVEAILAAAVGLALVLSFLSYVPDAPANNYVGPVGYRLADLLIQAFGYAAYVFPFLLVGAAVWLFAGAKGSPGAVRAAGAVAVLVECATALALARPEMPTEVAGGWVGGFAARLLSDAFGLVGSSLLLGAGGLLIFIMLTGLPVSRLAAALASAASLSASGLLRLVARAGRQVLAWVRLLIERAAAGLAKLPKPSISSWTMPKFKRQPSVVMDGYSSAGRTAPVEAAPVPLVPASPPVAVAGDEDGPQIVKTDVAAGARLDAKELAAQAAARQEEFYFDAETDSYRLPPANLLGASDEVRDFSNEKALVEHSKILEQKLSTFGIAGRVVAVRPGPVITTFEFEPDAGIKVSRVVNLCDDLTMALRAHSVRIIAPIPGKNVVGIEVSNRDRSVVGLRDLIDSEEFSLHPSPLALAIGRSTTGVPVYADLTAMPHLLMAGATGTGKSVALNAMILSILYKSTPRDVRFIMIDPKMLEMALYDGIPHLLVPVVTDVKKAAAALANVMREMDRRFEMLRDMRVRGIDDYNRRFQERLEAGESFEQAGDDDEGKTPIVHEHLPRVVVVVDELADLMMSAGREIEISVTRLAQKARAAGIHLILATQRPSVDVITGLIKANFPARISFKVTARPDSRTILDSVGAERLLGNGDMLYLAPGTSFLQRNHGALITDREVREIVDFLKKQGEPDYRMELLEDASAQAAEDDEDFFDELYERAVDLVTEQGQGSTSWLQRKLGIGYNRAARIMEHMEHSGIVGPADGVRPRQVVGRMAAE